MPMTFTVDTITFALGPLAFLAEFCYGLTSFGGGTMFNLGWQILALCGLVTGALKDAAGKMTIYVLVVDAVQVYMLRQLLDWESLKLVFVAAVCFIPMVMCGAKLLLVVDGALLKHIFGLVMLWCALYRAYCLFVLPPVPKAQQEPSVAESVIECNTRSRQRNSIAHSVHDPLGKTTLLGSRFSRPWSYVDSRASAVSPHLAPSRRERRMRTLSASLKGLPVDLQVSLLDKDHLPEDMNDVNHPKSLSGSLNEEEEHLREEFRDDLFDATTSQCSSSATSSSSKSSQREEEVDSGDNTDATTGSAPIANKKLLRVEIAIRTSSASSSGSSASNSPASIHKADREVSSMSSKSKARRSSSSRGSSSRVPPAISGKDDAEASLPLLGPNSPTTDDEDTEQESTSTNATNGKVSKMVSTTRVQCTPFPMPQPGRHSRSNSCESNHMVSTASPTVIDGAVSHYSEYEQSLEKQGLGIDLFDRKVLLYTCLAFSLSGLTGGMFFSTGPPLMIYVSYFSSKGLDMHRWRASFSMIKAMGDVSRLIALSSAGLVFDDWSVYIILSVCALTGLSIANTLAQYVTKSQFESMILVALSMSALTFLTAATKYQQFCMVGMAAFLVLFLLVKFLSWQCRLVRSRCHCVERLPCIGCYPLSCLFPDCCGPAPLDRHFSPDVLAPLVPPEQGGGQVPGGPPYQNGRGPADCLQAQNGLHTVNDTLSSDIEPPIAITVLSPPRTISPNNLH